MEFRGADKLNRPRNNCAAGQEYCGQWMVAAGLFLHVTGDNHVLHFGVDVLGQNTFGYKLIF